MTYSPEEREERREKLTEMFGQLLAEASFELPQSDRTLVDEFVENYEFGVALEWLTASLREHHIRVSYGDIDKLKALSREMKMDAGKLADLAVVDDQ